MKKLSTDNNNGSIRLRFMHQGTKYSFHFGLRYTAENLDRIAPVLARMQADRNCGNLDVTGRRYGLGNAIFHPSSHTQVEIPANISGEQVKQHFIYWTTYIRQRDVELDVDYRSVLAVMQRWGTFTSENMLERLQEEKWSTYTFNRRLGMLQRFTAWLRKKRCLKDDPLEDVVKRRNRTDVLPDAVTTTGLREPFTDDEIVRILQAFKNDTYTPLANKIPDSHYYPFLYFIFRTGARNAEAIGLKVKDIDLHGKVVHIRRSLPRTYQHKVLKDGTRKVVYARMEKLPKRGSVNKNYQREFSLSADLEAVLAPLLPGRQPHDHVFRTYLVGGPMDDRNFHNRYFYRVLDALQIPRRNLYAARHTLITRSVNHGYDIPRIAQQVGNSPRMIERVYLHKLAHTFEFPMWELV